LSGLILDVEEDWSAGKRDAFTLFFSTVAFGDIAAAGRQDSPSFNGMVTYM